MTYSPEEPKLVESEEMSYTFMTIHSSSSCEPGLLNFKSSPVKAGDHIRNSDCAAIFPRIYGHSCYGSLRGSGDLTGDCGRISTGFSRLSECSGGSGLSRFRSAAVIHFSLLAIQFPRSSSQQALGPCHFRGRGLFAIVLIPLNVIGLPEE
jgi:hypothetical protein